MYSHDLESAMKENDHCPKIISRVENEKGLSASLLIYTQTFFTLNPQFVIEK